MDKNTADCIVTVAIVISFVIIAIGFFYFDSKR